MLSRSMRFSLSVAVPQVKFSPSLLACSLLNEGYLIKQFADDAGRKGGEFYTKGVVQLVVEVLDPRPGMNVYDPACGSGGMLVETGALPQ